MSHPDDLLSAYLDGELEAWQERQVRSHLEACGACRQELHDAHEARAALRALPAPDLPPGLLEPAGPGSMPTGRRRFLLAVAAALVVLVAGFGWVGSRPERLLLDLETIAEQHVARAVLEPGPVPIRLTAAITE